jgi:hypothetical protein
VGEVVDVVIPCHPKDFDILPHCLRSVRDHVVGAEDIYVVSSEAGDWGHGIWWVDENNKYCFPFDTSDIESRLHCEPGIARWYRQQLIKLSMAPLLSVRRWLQVDADIVFQRPVTFVDEKGVSLFSHYCEPHYHEPYFGHARRLIPGFMPQSRQSLIAHHVLYDRDVLEYMFREVEAHHGRPFWEAYLACVDPAWVNKSGAAENELYSHYALWRFPDRCRIRDLSFAERKTYAPDTSLDFVSCQSWNRE